MTTKTTAQAARRHLLTISEAQAEAMSTTDPDTLAALISAVVALTGGDDSGDVTEHACITVASFYRGGGAADTMHAARAAVRAARRTVALAGALDGWDLTGDMTEEVTTAWDLADTRSTLSHWGTAPADLCTVTTAGDVVDYAVDSVTGPERVALERAVTDYRGHDESDCTRCAPGAGRRPSLTGMTAHVSGWNGEDAAYHQSRRLTVAALRHVDRERVLTELGGAPLAGAPRHGRSTGGDRTPRTAPPEPVLTVTTREGHVTVRNLTDGETEALKHSGARTAGDRYEGEEYGVSTAPERNDVTLSGQVRSHKPVVSPRKRAAGNTGPTVPVRGR